MKAENQKLLLETIQAMLDRIEALEEETHDLGDIRHTVETLEIKVDLMDNEVCNLGSNVDENSAQIADLQDEISQIGNGDAE